MSNTQRPSIARKETRKTKESRQAALDQGVKITLGDDIYEVRIGDVTPVIERRFRRAYGVPVLGLIDELTDAPGLDSIGALMWLSRLIGGEDVELDDFLVSYADLDELEIEESGAQETDGSPEA